MSIGASTIFDWTFEPHDFFEVPTEFAVAGGLISIASGTAQGRFDVSCYEAGRDFRDAVQEALFDHFLAQQVKVAKRFTLSPAALLREYSGGGRDVTICLEPATARVTGGTVEFIITNSQGEVVQDSKAERLKTHKEFRERVMQLHSSGHVPRRLLQMFHNAQNDPENILVRLYEIRDCLAHELGGQAKAIARLGVTHGDWDRLGRLANNEPLLEGRHRGRHHTLRHASADELAFATTFAQKLIEAYVMNAAVLGP